jgi:hypothetical protein
MANLLQKLREGTPVSSEISIRGVKFTIVVVAADITRQIEERAEKYTTDNPNSTNKVSRDAFFNRELVFECLRDPNDLSKRVAENAEEIGTTFDGEELARICEKYANMVINKVPKLEFLSGADLDEIKKYLDVTQLKDLDTVSAVHLANFLRTIRSEI